LVNKELPDIINLLSEVFKDEIFNLKMHKKVYFQILEEKQDIFEDYINQIRSKWLMFKERNEKNLIKKTYTTFLNSEFHGLFKEYLEQFFGFSGNSLELISKEKTSDNNLLIEYNYNLSRKEIKLYEGLSKRIKANLRGLLFFTGYLYILIDVFGILIRKTIGEDILITLDCGIIKTKGTKEYLNFLILVRDDNKELFINYFYMTFYYFLKKFKGIPEEYYETLLKGRDKVYQIALDQYKSVKERLANLMYYFYKKCKLVENLCPLLDFLNFVCSRVEDSVFSKHEIIRKEFLDNFDYTIEKKNSLLRLFDFIDNESTLFSTFQANNLPSQKSQFNLFLLIIKYYFSSGLEGLEVGDLLFLPEIFTETLNDYNKNLNEGFIGSNTINDINNFINYFSVFSNLENLDVLFRKIFNIGISDINYHFFRSFLKSFDSKFNSLIDDENKILSENSKNELYNFNIVVDHLSRMLYVLIDKIFLKSSNPDDSSANFIDPRGRYIGKNIALRVLELFIFQEFNFSDDIWPEILLSLYSDKFKKDLKKYVEISDKYFYTDKDLTRFLTLYNLQSLDSTFYCEQWLINEIIIPLNNFIRNIRESIDNLSDKRLIKKKLKAYLLKDVKIKDKKYLHNIEFICDRLSEFWFVPK
jgi:hypothetical protein